MHLLVSSIGLKAVTDLGALHGAPIPDILRRLNVSEKELCDPLQRFSWDVFIQAIDDVSEALGGHEPLRKAGQDLLKVVPDFVPVARALLKPKPMLDFVFGVVDRVVYPMVEFDLQDHGDGQFTLDTRVPKHYRPAQSFWAVSAGAIAAMPGYLGLPLAKVTAKWDDHSANYKIRFPRQVSAPPPPPREDGHHPMIDLMRHLGLELVLHLANATALAERVKQGGAVLEQVVQHMLADVPHPAFIIEGGRTVRPANEPGRNLVQRDASVEAELLRALQQDAENPARYSVMNLLDGRHLLIRRGPKGEVERRLQVATERWKLTPRQAEVLQLIVRGSSNKEIAQTIGCAARTVEIHLSKMYEKASAESRLSLLANFWSNEI